MKTLLLTLLVPALAWAAEPSCWYQKDSTEVACTTDAFRLIKGKCIEDEESAKSCAVREKALGASLADLQDGLKACIASIPPPPEPRSMLKPRLAFALTVLGTAATSVAMFSNEDPSNRFMFAGGGLSVLALGAWLMESD